MEMKHPAPDLFKKSALLKMKRRPITDEERLPFVPPSQRILLISHCLRVSDRCKAKAGPRGLDCIECTPTCQVNILRKTALDYGYKSVCIAPGGSMALKFIKETRPLGIVAVACQKELEEGMESVKQLIEGNERHAPPIVLVPLTRDGCVDTQVDVEAAIGKIVLGCLPARMARAAEGNES